MSESVASSTPVRGRRRLVSIAAACAAVLILAAAGFGVAKLVTPTGPTAPDFTLTDQNGNPFTLSHLRGHAVALFFGYTHCPDVCPTTLAALAHAKRTLGARADNLRVVFVTVDPQRDSVAVMGRYVRLFDPSFIGLTGTSAQLAPVYAAYHVYHQQLPAHGALGYLIAHSSAIDFIGPSGHIRGTGDWGDTSSELAAEMRQSES
jgi:protein SCO1/2